jgi:2-hydroxy-6-oxonona-2,4-dienedioate hydrolase
MTRTTLFVIVGLLVAAGVIAAGWLGIEYRHDEREARARIDGGRVIETAAGPVEYAEAGDGPAVLVIHGAAGGCDQGLLIGEMLLPDGYRMIAPSRFGYLNAGIPQDASLEAQADAFAALLDELGVDEPIPVIGFSAGGPSALTFAMRHPERTSALLMMSAISYTEPPSDEGRAGLESAINRLVASDFGFWLAVRFAEPQVAALLGVPKPAQERLSETGWAQVDAVLDAILPLQERLPGIALDQSRHLPLETPLGTITAPTLVVHAQDDVLVPYANAEHTAQEIAGAQLVPVEYGGHFLADHGAEVQESVAAFLSALGS